MGANKRKAFVQKLRSKYKLAVFNEQTYEEVLVIRLSRLNVFTIIGFSVILLVVLVIFLIAFTGLKEYIPGYPDPTQRLLIVRNSERVDSLIMEIEKRNKFIENMKMIINGEVPNENPEDTVATENSDAIGENLSDDTAGWRSIDFTRSEEDSMFRALVEREEKFTPPQSTEQVLNPLLENTFFFPPLKGMVVNEFGNPQRHFGVDIVAGPGARVSAVMDGVVIFSGWTVETGYVIQIQHANNFISMYKHNERLLKSTGDHVKAGEAIAHVGNSGELTTGPHLHFELWHNGIPLDPKEYISF